MSSIIRTFVDHVNQKDMSTPTTPATDVLEAIHAVMHRLRARHHAALRDGEQDLTPLEARVLAFFAHHPDATQSELVEQTGRDKGQLARLVSGLRERGLLDAQPDEHDRRVTRLRLSAAARARHQAMQRVRAQLAEQAVQGLDAAERDSLMALLARVRDNLDAADPA